MSWVTRGILARFQPDRFDSDILHLKNKYHKYSFYGLEFELKATIRKLKKINSGPEYKALIKAKESLEKEIKIRQDPYYSPWK